MDSGKTAQTQDLAVPSFETYQTAVEQYKSQRQEWIGRRARAEALSERLIEKFKGVPQKKLQQLEFLAEIYHSNVKDIKIEGKPAEAQDSRILYRICEERLNAVRARSEEKSFDKRGLITDLGDLTDRMTVLVEASGQDLKYWLDMHSSQTGEDDLCRSDRIDSVLLSYELRRRSR